MGIQVPFVDSVARTRAQQAAQPGDVSFFAMAAVPDGWLKCNGAPLSRATYAALFSAIGTTYGAGDGVTTFNLPDLRGEFLRALDDGRGVDAGRGLGSLQMDANKSHTHGVDVWDGGGAAANNKVAPQTNASSVRQASAQATAADGGTEARPRNVAMVACMKY